MERIAGPAKTIEDAKTVHAAMNVLARRLKRAGISYAIVGNLALHAHGQPTIPRTVELLLTSSGFDEFRSRFVPKSYDSVANRSRRFIDRASGCVIEVRLTGHYPGRTSPRPIAFPDPKAATTRIAGIDFVDLTSLIELKLCAGTHQDLADVVNLIGVHELDDALIARLHASVRNAFMDCLEEKRRDDAFHAQS